MSQSPAPSASRSTRRVISAGFVGTTVEWYDFLVFGTLAALVFDKLFFPAADAAVGQLAAAATFGVGFLARPLGGLVFGHFGDRVGRRSVLLVSLLLMGIATVAIGLLPTYASAGALAPVLLVLFRLLQGLSVGGEQAGVSLLVVEHAGDGERGFAGSWVQSGSYVGPLLGTIIVAVLTATTTAEQFLAWGWRIPFLLAGVLVAVGLYIRYRVDETPAFEKTRAQKRVQRSPILDVLRTNPRGVLTSIGIYMGNTAPFYVIILFGLSYMVDSVGLSATESEIGNIVFIVAAAVGCIPFGSLSDRIGRKPVVLIGLVATIILTIPYFWILDTGNIALVYGVLLLAGLANAAQFAVAPAYLAELFDARNRYTGLSIGVQGAALLVGAPAFLVSSALLGLSGGSPWTVAVYLVVIEVIAVVAVLVAGETVGRRLTPGDDVAVEERSPQVPTGEELV